MSGQRPLPPSRPGAVPRQVRRPPVPNPAARPGQSNMPPGNPVRGSVPPRPDPRQFVGRLKRVVVAGSVVGAGVLWALVAEHVVGITSVQGNSGAGAAGPGGGSVPQATSPYDGFFGPPTAQGAAGALDPGGILGGGAGGNGGGVQAAGPGLVSGGGGAPIMTTSGS